MSEPTREQIDNALKNLGAQKRPESKLCKQCKQHQAPENNDRCYMCQ